MVRKCIGAFYLPYQSAVICRITNPSERGFICLLTSKRTVVWSSHKIVFKGNPIKLEHILVVLTLFLAEQRHEILSLIKLKKTMYLHFLFFLPQSLKACFLSLRKPCAQRRQETCKLLLTFK